MRQAVRIVALSAKESFAVAALAVLTFVEVGLAWMDISMWGGSPSLAVASMATGWAVSAPAVAAWACWSQGHRRRLGVQNVLPSLPRSRWAQWVLDGVPLLLGAWLARLLATAVLLGVAVVGGGQVGAGWVWVLMGLMAGDGLACVVGAVVGSLTRFLVMPAVVAVFGYAFVVAVHVFLPASAVAADPIDKAPRTALVCAGSGPVVCTLAENRGYVTAAAHTMREIYQHSALADELPGTVYLVDTAPAIGAAETLWPRVGLPTQRSLIPRQALPNSKRAVEDFVTSLAAGRCATAPSVPSLEPLFVGKGPASREYRDWFWRWLQASVTCDVPSVQRLVATEPESVGS
ncbi:hypothetical protein [Dermatophilus congolensis]|uniref:hypothetical protein n=1 Tax=Dermatophilus congolensis TaxID=1863 RepID=UPI001AAFB792|nr:hypothetical protein [Dermatophilus congolensis]MBO3143763.1 hypothetical protein [Dermatophilus congolensis]MBO3152754.1 hypothetical protein [Dermatophilus congolensis]MBO3160235.1 hypothetical protein [Dermatophilus congolensis]MBO3164039.1 hypothetical protein [Dermatophilus congolensis]MBO3177584.1 hypothetical protein [Dermatophilus congolensis]